MLFQPIFFSLLPQAKVSGKDSDSRIADYALDHLGDQAMLLLPTHGGKAAATAQRRLYKSISQSAAVPDEVKQKLVSLLAAEFSKKVSGRTGGLTGWVGGRKGRREADG